MPKGTPLSIVGSRFGRWTVVRRSGTDRFKNSVWLCRCDCGNSRRVVGSHLITGHSNSCGCGRKGNLFSRWTGHGLVSGSYVYNLKKNAHIRGLVFDVTPEYLDALAKRQGLRCALSGRLLTFERGGSASIDRKHNNRGYVKGNLQWIHKDLNDMRMGKTIGEFIALCRIVAAHNKE